MMWGQSGDTDDTNATVSILVDSKRDGLQDGDCDRLPSIAVGLQMR